MFCFTDNFNITLAFVTDFQTSKSTLVRYVKTSLTRLALGQRKRNEYQLASVAKNVHLTLITGYHCVFQQLIADIILVS